MKTAINGTVPAWWRSDLCEDAVHAARSALPNETCGLFYRQRQGGAVALEVFTGVMTPFSCFADPAQLIAFVYDTLGEAGVVEATFHSHPNGSRAFSLADRELALWSSKHLLVSKDLTDIDKWSLRFVDLIHKNWV